jgi:hypothetical protein
VEGRRHATGPPLASIADLQAYRIRRQTILGGLINQYDCAV